MDQDTHTIDECSRRYLGSTISPVKGSVRKLLAAASLVASLTSSMQQDYSII
jgi:hypothetical protein